MNKMRSILGFNLWEIALICGFIALFAMAAVPRFTESQVRSEVATVLSDLKKLATAMEAYRVDSGSYPCGVWNGTSWTSTGCKPALLTSPFSYLDRFPVDVFGSMQTPGTTIKYRLYGVAYTASAMPPGYIRNFNEYPRTSWMTWSLGPDLVTNTGGYFPLRAIIMNEALAMPYIGKNRNGFWLGGTGYYNGMRYDPTNGTISYGDIYYFGGESRWRSN